MPLLLESVHLLEKVQIASEAVAVILVEMQQYRLQTLRRPAYATSWQNKVAK